jgi:hypothetical protein
MRSLLGNQERETENPSNQASLETPRSRQGRLRISVGTSNRRRRAGGRGCHRQDSRDDHRPAADLR